uniref:Pet8p n=1 Tax=Colletotrichum fructicola (strain Nara gc5) TaxID=1213859 RepID=L2G3B1_COLFN
MSSANPPFTTALLAGALAGTTVDLSLFPLDTLKTRLHGSALVGSAPGAAFFFCTYEGSKGVIQRKLASAGDKKWTDPVSHMLAASLGEVAACAIRVPTEVVKQRAQAALYRGWGITVLREVPFTIIQFPLWERLKRWGRERKQNKNWKLDGKQTEYEVSAVESALYGSVAGAAAAGITTPLDVLKTRVMLSKEKEKVGDVLRGIYRQHGIRPFFAGIGPRVMWISIGGAIFLGSYQFAANTLTGAVL